MRPFGIQFGLRRLLLLGAFCSAIAAFAGFTIIRNRHVANAVAVVDITGSMNTRDMGTPRGSQSRLEAAKAALGNLVAELPCQSRIGVGVFTERISFLLFDPVEVCSNFDALNGAIADLDWRMAWEGDSYIAKGFYSGIDIAGSLKSDLIFMTDGHEAPPLPYTGIPQFEGKRGVVEGLLVGVGGSEKTPIPKFDDQGQQAGFYSETDVPQDNRFGEPPPGAELREGYNARNAPFGAMPAVGDEQLSSVKTDYLEKLAQITSLTYVELQHTPDLSDPLLSSTKAHLVPSATNLAPIPAFLAIVLLMLIYGLAANRRPSFPAFMRRQPST